MTESFPKHLVEHKTRKACKKLWEILREYYIKFKTFVRSALKNSKRYRKKDQKLCVKSSLDLGNKHSKKLASNNQELSATNNHKFLNNSHKSLASCQKPETCPDKAQESSDISSQENFVTRNQKTYRRQLSLLQPLNKSSIRQREPTGP